MVYPMPGRRMPEPFPMQPSIYTDLSNGHQLKPQLKEFARDAKNVALERLGQRQPEETGGIDLPVRMKKMNIPGEGPGVYVYMKTNDRITPGMSTPFKWITGAITGFVAPVMSFMLGRDFAQCRLAEQNLYEAKQFRVRTLTRYREAHTGNEDHYQLTKIAALNEALLTNSVKHRQRSLAAKCLMAAGVAIGTFVAVASGVFAVGAAVAAPLMLAGSCTAWAEWGYQAGQQAILDKRAQDVIGRADKVLHKQEQPVDVICDYPPPRYTTLEAEVEPVAPKVDRKATKPRDWCGTPPRVHHEPVERESRPERVTLYYRRG